MSASISGPEISGRTNSHEKPLCYFLWDAMVACTVQRIDVHEDCFIAVDGEVARRCTHGKVDLGTSRILGQQKGDVPRMLTDVVSVADMFTIKAVVWIVVVLVLNNVVVKSCATSSIDVVGILMVSSDVDTLVVVSNKVSVASATVSVKVSRKLVIAEMTVDVKKHVASVTSVVTVEVTYLVSVVTELHLDPYIAVLCRSANQTESYRNLYGRIIAMLYGRCQYST